MKRFLFGYKISEVNKLVDSLRDENERLKTENTKLKIQMKNNIDSAKSILLEEALKNNEKELIRLKTENNEIKSQNEILTRENISLQHQIALLQAIIDEAALTDE